MILSWYLYLSLYFPRIYDMYVGNGYLSDGSFKLNINTVVPKNIINNKVSTFIWHSRLRTCQFQLSMQTIDVRCVWNKK